MKVRIGNGGFEPVTSLETLEKRISNKLVETIADRVYEIGPTRVRRIGELIKDVAVEEAHKLFTTLSALIDQIDSGESYASFAAADLMTGITADWGYLRNGALSGQVTWNALSDHYYQFKRRHTPAHANQFFQFESGLKAEFDHFGVTLTDNVLGGVQVEVTPKLLEAQALGDRELVQELLLGSIMVHIFPKVTASLLPGLASQRWSEVNMEGDFEREAFSDAEGSFGIAKKLVNKANPYRPLVAPAVQFWILNRIPQAIYRRLSTYFNKAGWPK